MLIGLIFRGVAFEFRFQATPSHRPFWDRAFFGGSLLATFSQGVVVGAVINGFTVSGAFSGGMFDWLTRSACSADSDYAWPMRCSAPPGW